MNQDCLAHLRTSILLSTNAVDEATGALDETRPEVLAHKLALVGEYLLQAHTQVLEACKDLAAQKLQ